MAQWNQIAGFLGGHDACEARYAQNVAFLGGACLDDGQGFWLHGDVAFCNGNAVGGGFGAYVHHMGLALGVEVGEFIHGVCFQSQSLVSLVSA